MRASTAYFAGAGTVIAALVGGLGGGLLIADMISPPSPRQEMTRLEQRMSSQPIQPMASPAEPPQHAAAPPSPATESQPAAQAPPPKESAGSLIAPSAETVADTQAAPAAQSTPSLSRPISRQTADAPENAMARANDADLKTEVEVKRASVAKRKAERRARRLERRQEPRRKDRELLEVEERVREETEPRPLFASDPARIEMPRIRLFDVDAD